MHFRARVVVATQKGPLCALAKMHIFINSIASLLHGGHVSRWRDMARAASTHCPLNTRDRVRPATHQIVRSLCYTRSTGKCSAGAKSNRQTQCGSHPSGTHVLRITRVRLFAVPASLSQERGPCSSLCSLFSPYTSPSRCPPPPPPLSPCCIIRQRTIISQSQPSHDRSCFGGGGSGAASSSSTAGVGSSSSAFSGTSHSTLLRPRRPSSRAGE